MKRAVLSLAVIATAAFAVAPAMGDAPPAPAAGPSAIVIYDQPEFKGRSLTLTRATPDLAPFNFDDRVASLAIQGAGDWVLCENRNYAGRCVRVQAKADDMNLLQMGGRVSSLYPVPATPAPAAPTAAKP